MPVSASRLFGFSGVLRSHSGPDGDQTAAVSAQTGLTVRPATGITTRSILVTSSMPHKTHTLCRNSTRCIFICHKQTRLDIGQLSRPVDNHRSDLIISHIHTTQKHSVYSNTRRGQISSYHTFTPHRTLCIQ